MAVKKDVLYSFYRIRKIIGLLGIALPFLVIGTFGEVLASISHYYYTPSSLFFTAILSSFGILLISYKGYEIDKGTEWFSDNFITSLGGYAAILVVLLPTACANSGSEFVEAYCRSGEYPLFGHDNKLINTIHLASAGIFLLTMGYMSIFRFTKGPRTPERIRNNRIFITTGVIVWVSIAILGLEFLFDFHFTIYDVLILECVSVIAFGTSWLIKGRAIKDLFEFRNMIFKPKSIASEVTSDEPASSEEG